MGSEEHSAAHLFILRLWFEILQEGQGEWRGGLRNVATGETRYFRDWPALIGHLQAMLPAAEAQGGGIPGDRPVESFEDSWQP